MRVRTLGSLHSARFLVLLPPAPMCQNFRCVTPYLVYKTLGIGPPALFMLRKHPARQATAPALPGSFNTLSHGCLISTVKQLFKSFCWIVSDTFCLSYCLFNVSVHLSEVAHRGQKRALEPTPELLLGDHLPTHLSLQAVYLTSWL